MSLITIRKTCTYVEDIIHEGGPPAATPLRRGAIACVLANPYAGRFEPDILPLMEALKPLGVDLAQRLIVALGDDRTRVEGYGKGAIIGGAGEIEHGALWHVPGGYAMRDSLGEALAIVPSAKKVGAIGARLDVPLTHINASYVRSHFDAIEIGVPDAPRADEMIVILAMSTGPRVHARIGGLRASEISVRDGLR